MQKVTRFLMLFVIAVSVLSFIHPNKEKVNWISIKELNELYSKNPKPILLDVYTDWCGWCKEMDRTTYKNEKLVKYINDHYYAVKLNAESPDSMIFNNKKYGYKSRYKSNELAEYLLFGQMQFPTTVFLPTIDARPAPLAGYLSAKEMEAPLKYFGEGVHKNKTFVEFNKGMKNEW
jgi:thioredoxin-related protein